jgi:hypothetical protein
VDVGDALGLAADDFDRGALADEASDFAPVVEVPPCAAGLDSDGRAGRQAFTAPSAGEPGDRVFIDFERDDEGGPYGGGAPTSVAGQAERATATTVRRRHRTPLGVGAAATAAGAGASRTAYGRRPYVGTLAFSDVIVASCIVGPFL